MAAGPRDVHGLPRDLGPTSAPPRTSAVSPTTTASARTGGPRRPRRRTVAFRVVPQVSIPLSALLDGEQTTAALFAGAALTPVGDYLGALRGGRGP